MKESGQRIIIVLGGSNDIDGTLSKTSFSRLDCCLENYQKGDLIICTGGWGHNFNKNEKPHAYFAQSYLIKKGLSKKTILESALSANTVEDAVMSKSILSKIEFDRLLVITSDFHLKRAKLIFDQIFDQYILSYKTAASQLSEDELTHRINHERQAVAWIEKNGLQY